MVDPELINVLHSFKDEISFFKNEIKNEMSSFKDEMKNEMNSFKDEVKHEMSSFKDEVKNEMNSFKDEVKHEMSSFKDEVKVELNNINKRLTSVENKCTIIEEEHGRKLDLLLDYASANIEKHEEYNNKFKKIDNKLFIHDAKLAIIEGSDIYKKEIKGKGKSNLRKAIL